MLTMHAGERRRRHDSWYTMTPKGRAICYMPCNKYMYMYTMRNMSCRAMQKGKCKRIPWKMANYNYFCLVTLVKGLRKILRVSWTAKKTNEWVLNKAGVKRELLDTVKAGKLAYCGYTMRKQGNCLKKQCKEQCQVHVGKKTTHGLDRQHQDVDRTLCGRVNQNDRG